MCTNRLGVFLRSHTPMRTCTSSTVKIVLPKACWATPLGDLSAYAVQGTKTILPSKYTTSSSWMFNSLFHFAAGSSVSTSRGPSVLWPLFSPHAGHFQFLDSVSPLQRAICEPGSASDEVVRGLSQAVMVAWGETMVQNTGGSKNPKAFFKVHPWNDTEDDGKWCSGERGRGGRFRRDFGRRFWAR